MCSLLTISGSIFHVKLHAKKKKSFPLKGVAAKEEVSRLILLWHTSESRCANWGETVKNCNSSTWGTEAIGPGFTVFQSYTASSGTTWVT